MGTSGGTSGITARCGRALGRRARAVRRAARRDGPLLVLAVALVALGVGLRVTDLGFPPRLTWDEHHFVENARNYIAHRHDWNDHPPLGKLLMALAMLSVGDTSVGWRLVPLLFGLSNVVLAGALGARLFRDRRAGWLAAAFVAGDGFLISYSRTALLDGMLTTFVLATVFLAVRARTPLRVLGVAVVIGLAASIKTSGFALGLPCSVLCLGNRRRVASLAMLAVAPALYTALFSLGLFVAHEPWSPAAALGRTVALLRAAGAENSFKHPLTSHWYTWFLPKRPITLRYDAVGPFHVRVSTTLGNLLLWWSAAAALASAGVIFAESSVKVLRARFGPVRLGREARAVSVAFSFSLTMLLPWMSGFRDSYIYHYLPSYTLLLVLVAGLVSRLYRRRRVAALGFVAAVTLVSAFYAPVWGQLEITRAAFDARLFLPAWR